MYFEIIQTQNRKPNNNQKASPQPHNRGQHSPIQTDLVRLIRCLLYGKEETLIRLNVTSLLTFCLQAELSLVVRPFYFFLSSGFLALP